MTDDVDILMITHNRPVYTRLALDRLLATCDDGARVWLWHNGTDEETLGVAMTYREHPKVYRFHHSVRNERLRAPTNWILAEGKGGFVSKVDDDCLVPFDWLSVLRKAHLDEPRFGAIGCWRFMPEDFDPSVASHKLTTFRGAHKLLCHPWVEGSGFLLKRACVERIGLLRSSESGLTRYFVRTALRGWVNGWYFPFLWQEHMDDPRAPHTLLKSDDDLIKYLPLTAENFGITSLADWDALLRRDAAQILSSPSNPKYYARWRVFLRRRAGFVQAMLRG